MYSYNILHTYIQLHIYAWFFHLKLFRFFCRSMHNITSPSCIKCLFYNSTALPYVATYHHTKIQYPRYTYIAYIYYLHHFIYRLWSSLIMSYPNLNN